MAFDLRLRRSVPQVDVWTARAMLYFLVQGAGLLAAYALLGFDTDKNTFLPGMRLDPIHAGVHFFWGLAGSWVGFFHPRWALPMLFCFAGFYIGLAVLGTFAPAQYHCGMQLERGENIFHWIVGPGVMGIALYCAFTRSSGQ